MNGKACCQQLTIQAAEQDHTLAAFRGSRLECPLRRADLSLFLSRQPPYRLHYGTIDQVRLASYDISFASNLRSKVCRAYGG